MGIIRRPAMEIRPNDDNLLYRRYRYFKALLERGAVLR